MAKYTFTSKAVEDISNIWDYTYEVWSENQADKYYRLLIEACQDIAKNPTIGKEYNEVAQEILGYRMGKHIIFYQKITDQEIKVIRILHGRMDLKNKMDQ